MSNLITVSIVRETDKAVLAEDADGRRFRNDDYVIRLTLTSDGPYDVRIDLYADLYDTVWDDHRAWVEDFHRVYGRDIGFPRDIAQWSADTDKAGPVMCINAGPHEIRRTADLDSVVHEALAAAGISGSIWD